MSIFQLRGQGFASLHCQFAPAGRCYNCTISWAKSMLLHLWSYIAVYWNHWKQLMSLKCLIFISWLGTGHSCGAVSQSVLTLYNFPAATWSHGVYWLQEKVPITMHLRAEISNFKSYPFRGSEKLPLRCEGQTFASVYLQNMFAASETTMNPTSC